MPGPPAPTPRPSQLVAAERRRIARALHDVVVQELLGLALDLEAMSAGHGAPRGAPPVAGPELAARLRASVRDLRLLVEDLGGNRDVRPLPGPLAPPA
jgi:signal transduction histidine kinase